MSITSFLPPLSSSKTENWSAQFQGFDEFSVANILSNNTFVSAAKLFFTFFLFESWCSEVFNLSLPIQFSKFSWKLLRSLSHARLVWDNTNAFLECLVTEYDLLLFLQNNGFQMLDQPSKLWISYTLQLKGGKPFQHNINVSNNKWHLIFGFETSMTSL